MGMGNLADELDSLSDEEEGEITGDVEMAEGEGEGVEVDGARDSGIDVSYSSGVEKSGQRLSRPFCDATNQRDEDKEEQLSVELEEAMSSIARMASTNTTTTEDPLIPRAVAQLQDLGNQSTLEAGTQRLTTSTNSVTAHLLAQTKALQTFVTSLYSPFAFSAPLDLDLVEETLPLIAALLAELPRPDPAALQGIQKLDRETLNVIHTLSQMTDTLQMGKQTTNTASRHLRTTQTMVAELRRERERAEEARESLQKSDWEGRIAARWCKGQCEDVVRGFEQRCEELRESLVEAAA